ncbi:MAG: hypothetical protein J6C44_10790 [Muribaculaceae bacterium]|nr:hypothetical protein [Muribaculaceae bacterium]
MKTKIYISSLVAMAMAVSMSSCDDNAWNNHLDGFEEENDKPISNVQTLEYTLTDADYAAIASNATNKALAGDELKAALASVGTRHAFSEEIPAAQYVPAFLASTSFPYFTATDGSSVKLTYNISTGVPAEVKAAANAQTYTITEDDYQDYVWGSTEDYIDAFAPSKNPGRILPGILAESCTPEDGEYLVVSYKVSNQEPVFGNVSGGDDKPTWEPSDVIASVALNDNVEVKAVVTGICAQGYIITDKSGSILVYMGSSFDASSVAIGQQVEIAGTIGAYNKGFQITGSSATVNVIGQQTVTYPAAKVMTGADLDQAITRTDNAIAQYVKITGKAVVTERNINILVDGATTAQGSVYQGTAAQKATFVDGETYTVEGYFIAIAGGRYFNMVVTSVNGKAVANAPKRHAAAVEVPTEAVNAVYHWDAANKRWSAPANFIVLNPADYTAMGQQYQNLTKPGLYLPTYLKNKYPYAQAEDVKNVMYLYYDSSAKTTFYLCDQYKFDGAEWKLNDGITTETNQFVRTGGKWMYDPCVTITLPAGRNQELSMIYFQACVDWVFENICKPLGDTDIKSGKFYISSYGNNEYYSGTSAYQGNVDLRPSAARGQYPAEYESMSDDEIVALEKKRFMNEVMPGALGKLHPDAKPVEGVDVIYTINFSVYTGTTTAYTARFRVTAPGKFEPIDCTWDTPSK